MSEENEAWQGTPFCRTKKEIPQPVNRRAHRTGSKAFFIREANLLSLEKKPKRRNYVNFLPFSTIWCKET